MLFRLQFVFQVDRIGRPSSVRMTLIISNNHYLFWRSETQVVNCMAATYPDLTANETLVREMSEAVWGPEGSPGVIEQYYTEDFVSHEPGETIEGRDPYKAYETALRTGIPDLSGEVDLVVCQDEFVACSYSASGTHTNELWGIPPTNETVTVEGLCIYRLENGKIAESWHQFDRLELFQQLGLVPENPAE